MRFPPHICISTYLYKCIHTHTRVIIRLKNSGGRRLKIVPQHARARVRQVDNDLISRTTYMLRFVFFSDALDDRRHYSNCLSVSLSDGNNCQEGERAKLHSPRKLAPAETLKERERERESDGSHLLIVYSCVVARECLLSFSFSLVMLYTMSQFMFPKFYTRNM